MNCLVKCAYFRLYAAELENKLFILQTVPDLAKSNAGISVVVTTGLHDFIGTLNFSDNLVGAVDLWSCFQCKRQN